MQIMLSPWRKELASHLRFPSYKGHHIHTNNQYPIPLPYQLKESKQDKKFSILLSMLLKVNTNFPLLEVIKMPSSVNVFKELNIKKREYKFNERIIVSKVASALLQHQNLIKI